MLSFFLVLALFSWAEALDFCGDDEAYYNIYRVRSNNCPCNAKTNGALRYENKQLKICDGKKYTLVNERELGSVYNPAKSCKDLLKDNPNRASGMYYIKPKRQSKVEYVYCYMNKICGKQGWTMVLKADGSKKTFTYDSALWTNKKVYNPEGATGGINDDQETKLPCYNDLPFSKICLGMKFKGKTNWLTINQKAESLHSLIADGSYRSANVGREKWKSLISGSSLQRNCNREGFNVMGDGKKDEKKKARIRIGIIANQENNCKTPDSRIGVGGDGDYCGQDPANSVGNEARCSPDNRDKSLMAFGYILVA